jgi:hypothetical protein
LLAEKLLDVLVTERCTDHRMPRPKVDWAATLNDKAEIIGNAVLDILDDGAEDVILQLSWKLYQNLERIHSH